MIGRAAAASRILIVTHSNALAEALQEETGNHPRRVIKVAGATTIEGLKLTGEYRSNEDEEGD
jgi:predicted ATPase